MRNRFEVVAPAVELVVAVVAVANPPARCDLRDAGGFSFVMLGSLQESRFRRLPETVGWKNVDLVFGHYLAKISPTCSASAPPS